MIRIVKLTIAEGKIESFLNVFNNAKDKVRKFEGCQGLELLNDLSNKNIFFTYSYWEDESNLEAYRNSEVFLGFWKRLKPLFSAKTEAWSVESKLKL